MGAFTYDVCSNMGLGWGGGFPEADSGVNRGRSHAGVNKEV